MSGVNVTPSSGRWPLFSRGRSIGTSSADPIEGGPEVGLEVFEAADLVDGDLVVDRVLRPRAEEPGAPQPGPELGSRIEVAGAPPVRRLDLVPRISLEAELVVAVPRRAPDAGSDPPRRYVAVVLASSAPVVERHRPDGARVVANGQLRQRVPPALMVALVATDDDVVGPEERGQEPLHARAGRLARLHEDEPMPVTDDHRRPPQLDASLTVDQRAVIGVYSRTLAPS